MAEEPEKGVVRGGIYPYTSDMQVLPPPPAKMLCKASRGFTFYMQVTNVISSYVVLLYRNILVGYEPIIDYLIFSHIWGYSS